MKDKIEKVNRAMEQEGFDLTKGDKKNLQEIASGAKTPNETISEIKSQLERIKLTLEKDINSDEKVSKKQ